ncbi:hypothetical protein [Geobacillus sp. C56-T2]|uniref:hypothetical protein n=1 Tax=Geobacillus sp. C56-T2 TaxID=600773 RepID=UPI00119DA434|nr:hypothetical protein [Geobacillus sp. C56-T2]TWG29348.1 hypothetical protein GC56T2_0387 [Geobacillus sp. C56-T2]
MDPFISCPQCKNPITVKDVMQFSSPWTMKCPYCDVKLKETRITPVLLLAAACIVPLFLFLTVQIKAFAASYWPVIEHVPAIVVFLVTLYPLYRMYERANATILCKKGRFQVKKKG